MTDNEIIKAWECCTDEMGCTKGCPCFNPKAKGSHCTVAKKFELENLTLDLIKRQKEQIESLIAGQETLRKALTEKDAEIEKLRKQSSNSHDVMMNIVKANGG